jgi:hypothetical protein
MSATILFVGHDANRAGAEIALLHILTWLRAARPEEPRVLLRTGGDLLADYARLAPTYRLEEAPTRAGLATRAFRRLHVIPRLHRVPRALRRERIDLVYLNTVAVAHLAPELKAAWHAPVVLHLRELERPSAPIAAANASARRSRMSMLVSPALGVRRTC